MQSIDTTVVQRWTDGPDKQAQCMFKYTQDSAVAVSILQMNYIDETVDFNAVAGPENPAPDTSRCPSDERVCLWDNAVLLQDLLWDAPKWWVTFNIKHCVTFYIDISLYCKIF